MCLIYNSLISHFIFVIFHIFIFNILILILIFLSLFLIVMYILIFILLSNLLVILCVRGLGWIVLCYFLNGWIELDFSKIDFWRCCGMYLVFSCILIFCFEVRMCLERCDVLSKELIMASIILNMCLYRTGLFCVDILLDWWQRGHHFVWSCWRRIAGRSSAPSFYIK